MPKQITPAQQLIQRKLDYIALLTTADLIRDHIDEMRRNLDAIVRYLDDGAQSAQRLREDTDILTASAILLGRAVAQHLEEAA